MIGIVVAAHGGLAEALVQTARTVVSEGAPIEAVAITETDDAAQGACRDSPRKSQQLAQPSLLTSDPVSRCSRSTRSQNSSSFSASVGIVALHLLPRADLSGLKLGHSGKDVGEHEPFRVLSGLVAKRREGLLPKSVHHPPLSALHHSPTCPSIDISNTCHTSGPACVEPT